MSYRYIYDPVARSEQAADSLVKEVKERLAVIYSDPFRYRMLTKNTGKHR